MIVQNPILPGFYPDPSICRVGGDYYLVASSFSYFPGVPIFHSTDLAHWRQIGHVLDRPSQLNLVDQGISAGIYAPAIRFHEGLFYVVTTFIGGGGNFYVTAEDPAGPWSDPIWLPEIEGIDPSFFFDEDGRAYIVNNGPPEGEPLYQGHCALWLQEFDLAAGRLNGPRRVIVNGGTDLAKQPIWIEGPHLFRQTGNYFLFAAEGGTEARHSEVVFRSRSIWGPYEPWAGNPTLTQRDLPADRPSPITCTGHADLVELADGRWVAVFLGCQPYEGDYVFNTGRETFLLQVDWRGEWPVILERTLTVPTAFSLPGLGQSGKLSFARRSEDWRDDFDGPELLPEWIFIRTPTERWFAIGDGQLRIEARPVSIDERGNPSFIGRRLQHAHAEFTASLRLEPGKEMEAGLVAFQNEKFYYKFVVIQSSSGQSLLVASAREVLSESELTGVAPGDPICLRLVILGADMTCEFSLDNQTWTPAGPTLDARDLSTARATGFTGALLALYAHAPTPAQATFDWAIYRRLDPRSSP